MGNIGSIRIDSSDNPPSRDNHPLYFEAKFDNKYFSRDNHPLFFDTYFSCDPHKHTQTVDHVCFELDNKQINVWRHYFSWQQVKLTANFPSNTFFGTTNNFLKCVKKNPKNKYFSRDNPTPFFFDQIWQ